MQSQPWQPTLSLGMTSVVTGDEQIMEQGEQVASSSAG